MIKKLQKRLVWITIFSLLFALLLNLVGMSIINYLRFLKNSDEMLNRLWDTKSLFVYTDVPDSADPAYDPEKRSSRTVFFSAIADSETGELLKLAPPFMSKEFAERVERMTKKIVNKTSSRGYADYYRYYRWQEADGQVHFIFVDCEKDLMSFIRFIMIGLGITFAGYALAVTIIGLSYNRVLRAIYEDTKIYQRYIVDAGHEFKTPIAIILADADVLEMELGANEWLKDIQNQTRRLDGLTNDLGLLARMEQAREEIQMIDFPVSDVISEAATAFHMAAAARKISIEMNVQPMLSMFGNDKAIHQLVTILMDNALKYAPDGSQISLTFELKNAVLQLCVYNQSNYQIPKESLTHLFDRFYRIDHVEESRTKGYGIGLSLAKAIVNAHKGKIEALSPDGTSMQIVATFPI